MPKPKKLLVGNKTENKKRENHEAKFCTLANKWFVAIGYTMLDTTNGVEAKIVMNHDKFYFSQMRPHQMESLKRIEDRMAYKISDIDRTTRKPFDMVWFRKSEGKIAVKWIRHGNKEFYLFDRSEIENLEKKGFVSLSEEEVATLKTVIKITY